MTAVRHLEPKVEQLEADVDGVRDDLSRLINKVPAVTAARFLSISHCLNTAIL